MSREHSAFPLWVRERFADPAWNHTGSRSLAYYGDLLVELVRRDLKLRYRGAILGFAWSLLNPIISLVIFVFIFRHALLLDIENYPAYVFTALLAWGWFQGSVAASANAIIHGRHLIRRPGFPAAMLPVVTVSSNLVHFVLALPVLLVFLILSGIDLSWTVALLPFIILIQFAFTLGLGYFVAALQVAFRDTQHVVGVFLMLFFYITPVFYDIATLPQGTRGLIRLNPLYHLLESYRALFLYGEVPGWRPLLVVAAISAILLLTGYRFLQSASYRFVEEL